MSRLPESVITEGFFDLHDHLRQPSPENKSETIESGTRAALLGGFVLVCDMPNNPGHRTNSFSRLVEKQEIIEETAHIPVGTYAGSQPEDDNIGELQNMSKLAIGLKLYFGRTTGMEERYADAADFKPIVKEWDKRTKKPIMGHIGEVDLLEVIYMIAKERGHHFHLCHVNKPEEVRTINMAKKMGLPVSCGICPQHLLFTTSDLSTRGWEVRCKPLVPDQIDQDELWWQLKKGMIDNIETDHAPHSREDKERAERENPNGADDPAYPTPFGVPGFDSLPPLFHKMDIRRIDWEQREELLSKGPRRILGLKHSPKTYVKRDLRDYRIENDSHVATGAGYNPYLGMRAAASVVEVSIGGKRLLQDRRPTGVRVPKVIRRIGSTI